MKETVPLSRPAAIPDTADARVQQILALLHQEPGRNHQWKELAQQVNLSLRHLERLFKAATEQTLPAYLRELRIECACELLATTFLSAKQIADRLGFKHENHFNRTFKQAKGLTPIAYRKRCEQQKKSGMSE